MKRFLVLLVPCLLLASVGCKGGQKSDPILALSAQESYDQGKQWLEREKYYKARRYLTHAYEIAPNSPIGREALLMAADTFYQQGGEANFIQAEAKYRDFLNRFPTSPRAAYVQFQIAKSLAERIDKPDRDQSTTQRAVQSYEDVLRLYPTSEYAAKAREEIIAVRNQLAEHEFGVGKFYLSYGLAIAAVGRFEGLLEEFPDYDQRDKIFLHLGLAYVNMKQPHKAADQFNKLRREFPQSEWLKKVPELSPQEVAAARRAEAEKAGLEDEGSPDGEAEP